MQEMQFASFASSEWKGVVGTLPGIETQGSYSAATRCSTSSYGGYLDSIFPGHTVSSQNIFSGIFLQEYLWLEVCDTDTGDKPQNIFCMKNMLEE